MKMSLVIGASLVIAALALTPSATSACTGFCQAGVSRYHLKFPVYRPPNPAPSGPRVKVCCRPNLR